MDKKSRASGTKKKAVPKKKVPNEKQFERFVKTARELGVDESEKDFANVFLRIARPRKSHRQ
jgi:hypothetical protein